MGFVQSGLAVCLGRRQKSLLLAMLLVFNISSHPTSPVPGSPAGAPRAGQSDRTVPCSTWQLRRGRPGSPTHETRPKKLGNRGWAVIAWRGHIHLDLYLPWLCRAGDGLHGFILTASPLVGCRKPLAHKFPRCNWSRGDCYHEWFENNEYEWHLAWLTAA